MVTDIWGQKNPKKNERASITIVENMATAGCDQNGKQDFEKETNTRGNKWRFKEFHQNTSQPQMSMYYPPTQTHTKASHSNHCVIWSDTMKVFFDFILGYTPCERKVHWQQHSDRFHFEYRSVPRLCDPHVFVGQILRPCVMSKTINYSAGVQGRELGWSVPFLLDDAGLNKGPPTNTNTGSWLLSFTNFFVFLCQLKYVNTLHIQRLFGRVHWWKTTGVRRFTLQLQRGPVEIWFSSVTKCWPRSSKNTK